MKMRNHKENGNGSEMSEPKAVGQKNLAKMEPENNNKISVVSKLLLKDSNGASSRIANSNSNASFSSASVAGSVQVSLSLFFINRFRFSFPRPSDLCVLLVFIILVNKSSKARRIPIAQRADSHSPQRPGLS